MILNTVTGFLWIWRNPKLWEFLKINLRNITQKLTTRSSPVVDFSRTWVWVIHNSSIHRYLLFWCLLLKCKDFLHNFLYLNDTINTNILTSKIYYKYRQIYFVMRGHRHNFSVSKECWLLCSWLCLYCWAPGQALGQVRGGRGDRGGGDRVCQPS